MDLFNRSIADFLFCASGVRLETEAIYYIAGVGINYQHDFVSFVIVLREPYWSVKQLHIPDI